MDIGRAAFAPNVGCVSNLSLLKSWAWKSSFQARTGTCPGAGT